MKRDFDAKPGEFPYALGIYSGMYSNRPWKIMQYSGFGSVRQANDNFHKILNSGTKGISIAFDLPSQMGVSKYSEIGRIESGKVGVSVETLADMRILLHGIDLSEVNISMTINSTAAMMLLLLELVAEENGIQAQEIRATIQNDMLKEYISRNTYIFTPNKAMRIVGDIFEYCQKELPKVNPISVSGYHMEEAGATAAQEIGFAIANGVEYLKLAQGRNLDLERLAEQFTFFFSAKTNIVEEICKFRAARVLWAELLVESFGFTNAKALKMRIHAQTAGSELTSEQPENNFARVTIQGLAAIFGGVQSLHTNSFNEAHSLPTHNSSRIAINTQKIILHETDITDFPDLLKGAVVFEQKTEALINEARSIFEDIERIGGALKGVESNFQKNKIERESYLNQIRIENGNRIVVGRNDDGRSDENINSSHLYFEHQQERENEVVMNVYTHTNNVDLEKNLMHALNENLNLLYPMKELLRDGYSVSQICELIRKP
jgi:methylmalonyl-CoA mutase N-terminal domain/subunit